jgi:hypothetical protein
VPTCSSRARLSEISATVHSAAAHSPTRTQPAHEGNTGRPTCAAPSGSGRFPCGRPHKPLNSRKRVSGVVCAASGPGGARPYFRAGPDLSTAALLPVPSRRVMLAEPRDQRNRPGHPDAAGLLERPSPAAANCIRPPSPGQPLVHGQLASEWPQLVQATCIEKEEVALLTDFSIVLHSDGDFCTL